VSALLQNVLRVLTGAGAVAVILVLAFFVSRATGLLDRNIQSQRVTTPNDWQQGLVYRLNRVVLDVSATLEIVACKTVSIDPLTGDAPGEGGKTVYRTVDVSVVDAKVTPRAEPDPGEAWLIRSDTIEDMWWSTSFSASLDALGRLKEVNSSSTSVKADEILRPITGFLSELVGSVSKQVGTQVSSSGTRPEDAAFCGPLIDEALKRRTAIEARLAAKPGAEETAVLQGELVKANALLRRSYRSTVMPRRPSAPLDVRKATDDQLREWGLGLFVDPRTLFPEAGDGLKGELLGRAFEFRILAPLSPTSERRMLVDGIVHRIPAQARLVTCRQRCTFDENGAIPGYNLLKEPETVAIPQLGMDMTMPVRRRPFSERKAKFTFDATGVLTGIEVSDTVQMPGR
jgi:hypothetical protein